MNDLGNSYGEHSTDLQVTQPVRTFLFPFLPDFPDVLDTEEVEDSMASRRVKISICEFPFRVRAESEQANRKDLFIYFLDEADRLLASGTALSLT